LTSVSTIIASSSTGRPSSDESVAHSTESRSWRDDTFVSRRLDYWNSITGQYDRGLSRLRSILWFLSDGSTSDSVYRSTKFNYPSPRLYDVAVSRRQQTVLQAKLRVHCGTFELSPHRRLYCRYSRELTLSDLKLYSC